MKKLTILVLLLAFILPLAGCATVGDIPRQKLNDLRIGMTIKEIKTMLGEPYSTETYITKDKMTVMIVNYVVKYRTRNVFPLVFSADNILLGWGFDYYDSITQEKTGRRNLKSAMGIH